MIEIKKSEIIADKIKSLKLGLVEAKAVYVTHEDNKFDKELQLLEDELKDKFKENAPSENPVISATRRMYRQVGWEPTKYRPSSEALVRRIIQGKGLYKINNLVDYGNLVSARFHIPMGLYDIDMIKGEIILEVGREGESYEGISRPIISATGKIILRDSEGIFGNPTADSKRTSISKKTKNVLAVFFIASTIENGFAQKMLNCLSNYYSGFTKEGITTEILIL